jgi:dephospho-CoA kinase
MFARARSARGALFVLRKGAAMRVGLTGGIGSGKSAVANFLAQLGAFVIDTDELAREAVAPGSPGLAEIERLWPQVVVSGALDRAALADIVFADERARERLNSIVHPAVRRLAAELETNAAAGRTIVHVVPLLFETGYAALLDRSIVVIAPEADRIARVAARDGVDEARVRARMAAQLDPEAARLLADIAIDNDKDLEHLRQRTREVFEELASSEA